jgi:hypothetical protein
VSEGEMVYPGDCEGTSARQHETTT